MCNVLGKGLGLTRGYYCYRCGGENSIDHMLQSCDTLTDETRFDIDKLLTESKTNRCEV